MVTIPPGSSLGRYRVIEQLGRGGMATAFRAHDPTLDRYVAAKVLPSYYTEDPTFIGRFTQEAQTIARVSHPNILQIYDFGEDKGYTYIVTELIEGGDLQDRLTGEAMPLDQVLKIMRPLAEALDHAHALGIVHRDLKPANVLLDTDDRPILADFGLARMLESSTKFTQESQALGTPEYMAPEQGMGADADHRSDLYALGIMVYQMLVGQTPFRADTPAGTLMAHIHQPLPLPTVLNPKIEPRMESTLLKALAKTPDDRFQSAKEFIQGLEFAGGLATRPTGADDSAATAVMDAARLEGMLDDALDATAVIEAGAPASPETMPPRSQVAEEAAPEPAPPPHGRRWIYVGGAVAAVAVVAIVGVVLTSGGGDEVAEEPASNPLAAASAPEAAVSPEPAVAPEPEVPALSPGEITRGFFRRDYLRQQVFEAEELYKTLGMMDESQDLEDILYDIQLQTVRALYDEDTEKVYVISDIASVGPAAELAIALAYMGAVQQQLFDTSELRRRARIDGADQFRAINALIQGDVAQVGQGYISTFSTLEVEVLNAPVPDNKLLQAPQIVRETVLFPQREGANFVAEVFGRNGGWEGLAAAYADPPVSTEQVLHPEKYLADEKPMLSVAPDVSSKLGAGWSQINADTMGEFILKAYLAQYLTESETAAAVAGWGGDGYSLLTGPEGQRLMLSVIRWDSLEESKEFFDARYSWES